MSENEYEVKIDKCLNKIFYDFIVNDKVYDTDDPIFDHCNACLNIVLDKIKKEGLNKLSNRELFFICACFADRIRHIKIEKGECSLIGDEYDFYEEEDGLYIQMKQVASDAFKENYDYEESDNKDPIYHKSLVNLAKKQMQLYKEYIRKS